MGRKRNAKDVADRILREQVDYLRSKWERFQSGDPTSALTDLEQDFLLKLKRLEQEGDLQEAQASYLENLNDNDLELFYQKLEASLPAPEEKS